MKNSIFISIMSLLIVFNLQFCQLTRAQNGPCPQNKLLNGKWICTDPLTSCDPPPHGICNQGEKECLCNKRLYSPTPQVTSKSKWKEVNGAIIIPPPGNQTTLTFKIDTLYPGSFYKLEYNDFFGGGSIQTHPLSGTVSVHAVRRLAINEQNLMDFTLVFSLITSESINIPGLGTTGINNISYDSLLGIFDINTGRSLMIADGRITNNIFGPGFPVLFTTYQWGTVNIVTGEMIIDTREFDNPPVISEGFLDSIFAPASWSIAYTGISYWSRSSVSSYGTGTGSAKFNFRNAPFGTNQSLITKTFVRTVGGDSLRFDHAYAPFISGTDSLIIETSSDNGNTYSTLIGLFGRASGGPLNTSPVVTIPFVPANTQWATKRYALPVGTNKIKFRAKSGFGNNLYLDSICVGKFVSIQSYSTITVAPEGYLNPYPIDKLNKSDTIRAYLRSNSSPYNAVDSGMIVVDSVTLTGSLIFNNAASGTYYVVIKHRNSIETWSKNGGEIFTHGTGFDYDFSSLQTQTFGNNSVLKGITWCIYSGDVNQDQSIDLTDIIMVFNDANNFLSGYVVTDVTGDNFVDLSDLTVTYNNSNNFVSVIRP